MKTLIVPLLSSALLLPFAGDDKPGPDDVVVKTLDKPLPQEGYKRERFLWNNFANKPEEQKFDSYVADVWTTNFAAFANALVQKVHNQNLDSASLRKALDLVLKHSEGKIAYLPVGAYQATSDGKLVWIITVKWEYPSTGDKASLAHICMFAFDQQSLKQIGFASCG